MEPISLERAVPFRVKIDTSNGESLTLKVTDFGGQDAHDGRLAFRAKVEAVSGTTPFRVKSVVLLLARPSRRPQPDKIADRHFTAANAVAQVDDRTIGMLRGRNGGEFAFRVERAELVRGSRQ